MLFQHHLPPGKVDYNIQNTYIADPIPEPQYVLGPRPGVCLTTAKTPPLTTKIIVLTLLPSRISGLIHIIFSLDLGRELRSWEWMLGQR